MDWLAAAAGAVLVLLVRRDIFHTLGHPEGQGSLSRLVLRTSWRLSRPRGGRGRMARLSGPLALLAVIIVWGTLAVVGWALLYLSLIHISEPTRRTPISYAVFCLKKKTKKKT